MWSMDAALAFIRELQPALHSRLYHVAMGGGVLNKGFSEKDLDLYLFPFDNAVYEPILPYLEELWGPSTPLSSEINREERGYPQDMNFKTKVKFFLMDGRRIDLFITNNGMAA